MSVRDVARRGWIGVGRGIDAVRDRPARRWTLQLAVAAVGLALAGVHWTGIVAGGALVGVLSDNPRRAALAGFAFGVLVWLAFLVRLVVAGGLGTYLASGELLVASAAIAFGLGVLGGLSRALVP